ncbi:hypothetical protein N9D23_13835, partial [Rubripirellula sp.]|nr:hypothetical protein [Rubripirellula sp.]
MSRGHELSIFWIAALTRFGLFLIISLVSDGLGSISRDSAEFHLRAIETSEHYIAGTNTWSRWIDDAWPEFVGLCYAVLGHSLIPVMAINSMLVGVASVFLYRIALTASGDTGVAAATGFSFALFPSAIWFHSV